MTWTVLGFDKNKKYFEKLLAAQRLAQAYLFTGQEMIGKMTFALDLAGRVNNFSGQPASDPDMAVLNAETGWGIEKIRALQNFLVLRPEAGKYRIVIIDEAEKMGPEASNAFLKTLEEPPSRTLIFLVAANPRALLPTIVSRMVEIKFSPHRREELIGYLEKMDLSKTQAAFLADFANGRLGWAYRLQQRYGFASIRQNLEQFNELLKANDYYRLTFAENLFSGKTETDPRALILNWMFYLRSPFSRKLKINHLAVLRKMMETNNILSGPQYNHRLAFENLLLKLS